MNTSTQKTIVALLLGLAIFAAACASDDAATTTAFPDVASTTTPTTTETTPPEPTEAIEATPTAEPTPASSVDSIDVPVPVSVEDELQDALVAIVADTGVPALGAAVYDSNGLIDQATAGLRERGGFSPVTLDATFHIGSNTKAMTAALLGRLDQQGDQIGFDTTLAEIFGETYSVHDSYSDVTLAQLLSHTGGAPTDEDLSIDESIFELPLGQARALGAELILSDSPISEPGTENAYSNAGYVVVAAAMESAMGQSWEELIATEVFDPLAMDTCGFGVPGTDGIDDQPMGHDKATGEPVYFDNPALLAPAGGVHCSMADWGRFLVELLNGFNGESEFLSQATVQRLFEPASAPVDGLEGGAALGWLVASGPQGTAWFHNGSNTAWFSQAAIVPEIDRVVLAVSNEASTGEQATALAFAALAQIYPA